MGRRSGQAVLHAEVRHAQIGVLRIPLPEPSRLGQVAAQIVQRSIQVGEERRVSGRLLQPLPRDPAQQRHRVARVFLQHLRVQVLEHLERPAIPRPPEVVGQFLQPAQTRGDLGMDAECMNLAHFLPLASAAARRPFLLLGKPFHPPTAPTRSTGADPVPRAPASTTGSRHMDHRHGYRLSHTTQAGLSLP